MVEWCSFVRFLLESLPIALFQFSSSVLRNKMFVHFLRTIAKRLSSADGIVSVSSSASPCHPSPWFFESILAVTKSDQERVSERKREWRIFVCDSMPNAEGIYFSPIYTPILSNSCSWNTLPFSFYRNITNVNDCTVTYLAFIWDTGSRRQAEEKSNCMPSNDKFASWSSEIASHLHHYKFYWSCDDNAKIPRLEQWCLCFGAKKTPFRTFSREPTMPMLFWKPVWCRTQTQTQYLFLWYIFVSCFFLVRSLLVILLLLAFFLFLSTLQRQRFKSLCKNNAKEKCQILPEARATNIFMWCWCCCVRCFQMQSIH